MRASEERVPGEDAIGVVRRNGALSGWKRQTANDRALARRPSQRHARMIVTDSEPSPSLDQ